MAFFNRILTAVRRRYFLYKYQRNRYTEAQKAMIRLRAKGRL